jgi:uncharacterized protein YyaL (SSP411 family)
MQLPALLSAQAGAQSTRSSKKQKQQGLNATPSPSLMLGMSLFSLQAMASGGMYDQLGGGFHRYR